MSSPRRFVNLVLLDYSRNCLYSLRRLEASQFFYQTADQAAASQQARDLPVQRKARPRSYFWGTYETLNRKKKKKPVVPVLEPERIRSSRPPLFSVRPSSSPATITDFPNPLLQCFPLSSGTEIFFADGGGRTFLYHTESRSVITSPNLHAPKFYSPVSISVPGSLYIMDKILDPRRSFPFEALVFREDGAYGKTWHCDALPVPPELQDERACVLSHAVVGDAICVSAYKTGYEAVTYCFDTVSRTWSRAGEWQRSFQGKAGYVPELNLWFGISNTNGELPCAADLSPLPRGHAPEKIRIWGELAGDLPEEWGRLKDSHAQFVSLGSGRFCIANFFETLGVGSIGEVEADRQFALFTGLEAIAGSNGKFGVRLIKHKFKCLELTGGSVIQSVL